MKDPLYFPTAEQFKRDREARAHARRAAGRHMFRTSEAALDAVPSPLAAIPGQAPSLVCRRCGRRIHNGDPTADPVLTTCKECLNH